LVEPGATRAGLKVVPLTPFPVKVPPVKATLGTRVTAALLGHKTGIADNVTTVGVLTVIVFEAVAEHPLEFETVTERTSPEA